MMNKLAELVLKLISLGLLREELVRQYAERLRIALHTGVDVFVAYLLAVVLEWLNRPDTILEIYGDTTSSIVGSTALFAFLISLVRWLGPVFLKLFSGGGLGVLLFVFLSSYVAALEIHGATNVPTSGLIRFDAKVGEKSSVLWDFYPKGAIEYEVVSDGRRVLGNGPDGQYTVEVVEVGPSEDPNRPFFIHKVSKTFIKGGGPQPVPPGPEPIPPIPPVPPVPPDPDGLGFVAWSRANKILISDAQKVSETAAVFENVAANGPYSHPNLVMTAMVNGGQRRDGSGSYLGLNAVGIVRGHAYRVGLLNELTRKGMMPENNLGEAEARALAEKYVQVCRELASGLRQ